MKVILESMVWLQGCRTRTQLGVRCATLLIGCLWHVFFFFFFSFSDSSWFKLNRADSDGNGYRNGWYSPIPTETGCHHVAGLHSYASCGLERERERERDKDATASCAFTGEGSKLSSWNCDKYSKGESCGLLIDFWMGVCESFHILFLNRYVASILKI